MFTPLPLIQRGHRGQLVDEDRDLDDGRAQRRDDLAERQSQVKNPMMNTVCFIDLDKLNLLIISLPWSKSVKQTVECF